MNIGVITGYIDLAQLVLYAFWIFFAGLLIYLRKEDKREGYPLESDRSGRIKVQGYPSIPTPKVFTLMDGTRVSAPRAEHDARPIMATAVEGHQGAPLRPTGNPMLDAVGPAAYAERANIPDHTIDGLPLIVPLRESAEFYVSPKDPDPRGMDVYGADGERGGVVSDLWIDRAEPQIRYLEVDTVDGRQVLLPINFAKIHGRRRRVKVRAIMSTQFATVPGHASSDQVTRREEDRIMAYYAGGYLYAHPRRTEPVL